MMRWNASHGNPSDIQLPHLFLYLFPLPQNPMHSSIELPKIMHLQALCPNISQTERHGKNSFCYVSHWKTVVPWNAGPCWLANSLLGERSCNPAFHWRTKLPWLVVASNQSRCGWCTSVASSHHAPWAESQSTAVCPATTVPEFNCSDVTPDWNCLYPVIFKDTLYKTAFFSFLSIYTSTLLNQTYNHFWHGTVIIPLPWIPKG